MDGNCEGAQNEGKIGTMTHAQNSAKNSTTRRRENPDKIKPFRWPKGVSGNPGGRPRKKPLTELYAAFADVKLAELPLRIRRMFKDCDDVSLAANGALGLWLAMGRGNHSAARELREGIEGKLTEKIDLAVDVNKDIVERRMAARKRIAQGNKEPAG